MGQPCDIVLGTSGGCWVAGGVCVVACCGQQYHNTAADVLHGPSEGYRYISHVGGMRTQHVTTARTAGVRRVVQQH